MRPLDLIGKIFGRLTVDKRIGSQKGKSYWFCKCECGGTTKVIASNLTRGNVTSCGCFRKEFVRGNQLPDGVSGFNGLYSRYQVRAKKDGIDFQISKEDFQELTQQPCFYCGKPPLQSISSRHSGKGRYIYNGIDRVQSGDGYEKRNCVPCCADCNYMKTDMSVAEFISACQKIIAYQEKITTVGCGPTAKAI